MTPNKNKVLKIGYFGKQGSNTETAARKAFGKQEKYVIGARVYSSNHGVWFPHREVYMGQEYLPYETVEEVLEALKNGEIIKAVIPAENIIGGSVMASLIALVKSEMLRTSETEEDQIGIEGEIILPIKHRLIGVGPLSEIKTIFSHPQALQQCRRYLKNIKIETKDTASTSAAVKKVAENDDTDFAAIGSDEAYEIYKQMNSNLIILDYNIQDLENNKTRFIILGREKCHRLENVKTSIVFGLENKKGSLVRVLEVFDDINMSQIVSMPALTELGEYIFLVDLEEHKDSKDLKFALNKIAKRTTFLNILGSYLKA